MSDVKSSKRRGPYKKRTLKTETVVLSNSDQNVIEINSKRTKTNKDLFQADDQVHASGNEPHEATLNNVDETNDLVSMSSDKSIVVDAPEFIEATVYNFDATIENEPSVWRDEENESNPSTEPVIIINRSNDGVDYEQPNIGEQNSDYDYLLSELQDKLVNIDDHEYVDDDIATVLSDHIAELVSSDETVEIENCKDKEEIKQDIGNDPVFTGSQHKLGYMILFICCLSIRFKLPDECLNYILILTGMILPPGHNMIQSVYSLKEYLRKFVSFPKIHYLCSACGTHVQKNDRTCKNKTCHQNLSDPGTVGYFIQHSVINQLRIMVKRTLFLEKVRSHRFDHYKNNPKGNLRDVYDGNIYKKLFDNGFLENPNGISFSLNTDGVPVFKSSKISMWPVYMLINELPIGERKLKENIVYYGLWICSKKPVMWSYLKPLHEELCKLEDGIEMYDNKNEPFTLNAYLLNCVCDLPARCMMSNSMQFNGEFGCWFCYQSGSTHKTDKGGHTHIYPFQEDNPKGPSRTVESLQQDVNEVVANIHQNKKNYIVRGVKGPFWFMFLKSFDVIHGFVIDYMHGICSGVMKMLLTFWFDKNFKHESFSLHHEKSNVNGRLATIKANLNITRPPRTLDELCHWKSSEFRNFLFLWGIPVLHGILPQPYFMHFSLLVRGIYNLSRENVTNAEVENAEQCLFKFVELFVNFYPKRNLTMNCHQLLHIADNVRANGPLFANNCFIFEDLNGYLLKNIHGTTGVETQLINAITMMQALPTMQELYVENSEDALVINYILRPNYMFKNVCIEEGIFQLGQTFHRTLDEEESIALSIFLPTIKLSVISYNKIFIAKISSAVYGTAYGRLMKRNQNTVKYENMAGEIEFGCVKTFIQVTDSGITYNCALIHPFTCISNYSNLQSSHIVTLQYSKLVAVPLTKILKVCNIINSGDITYVSEFPNRYEKD